MYAHTYTQTYVHTNVFARRRQFSVFTVSLAAFQFYWHKVTRKENAKIKKKK